MTGPGQQSLFDVEEVPAARGLVYRREPAGCKWCHRTTQWVWAPVGRVWLCGHPECGLGQGFELTRRELTPEEREAVAEEDGFDVSHIDDYSPVGGWPEREAAS